MTLRPPILALLALGGCATASIAPANKPVVRVPHTDDAPPPVEAAPPAADTPPTPLPPTTETAWLSPCLVGTTPHTQAKASYQAIDAAIDALAPTDDPGPTWQRFEELLAGPCFALNAYDGWVEEPTSGLALRTWWDDGGDAWTEQYLELGEPRPEHRGSVWIRPSMRVAIAPELTPDHAFGELLCPVAEPRCDRRTRGWALRANAAFRSFAEQRWTSYADGDGEFGARRDWSACEDVAMAKPQDERYDTWSRCVRQMTLHQSVFAIGGVRAPDHGWLVVRGRRGHYRFCDELALYDLQSGAVHIARSCSGLALRDDGSVDGSKTHAAREVDTVSGRVPVDALREAAWMMLWSTETERDGVIGGYGYSLPVGIEPGAPDDGTIGLGGAFMMSSAQTTLDWAYVRRDRPRVQGTLRWPEDYNDGARDHAVRLLKITEAAMDPGCAPAGVPKLAVGGGGVSVSGLDADREELSETQRELEGALQEIRAPRCRGR